MSEPRIGEVVGGYRLEKELATGGMGVVFEARHVTLDRSAVVKVLAPKLAADDDFVSRFKHEARIASDLDHPCIVDVFDLVDVEQPRRVACVMERLEGPTLAKLLRQGPMRFAQAMNVTLQIADAIRCVHEAGVIHRDLKPQNIVVIGALETDLMAVPSVKILDFGIAKITETPTDHKTRTGAMLGTPAYMAPEQVAGTKVLPSTDLYAIAELLYEMLTGRRVFRGDNLDILRRKMATTPPELELDASVHGHDRLEALISACLHPDVDKRPAFADFEDVLSDLIDESALADALDGGGANADAQTIVDPAAVAFPFEPENEDPRVGDPGMNTQMFFDRIVEDIEDVDTEKDADRPAPPMQPKDEEHLTLMRSPGGWNPPARTPSVAPRSASVPPRTRSVVPRATSVPRVVVGSPVPPAKSKRGVWSTLAAIVALAVIGGGAYWAWSNGLLAAQEKKNPLIADARAWSATHGGFHGETAGLVTQLRNHLAKDTDAGYVAAIDAAKQLLVIDPGQPAAIALYVEARALFDPEHITRAEFDKLSGALDYVPASSEVRRARAALWTAVGREADAVQLLDRATAPLETQRLAEALVPTDPKRALELIEGSDAVRELPRSATIRGRALTARGHTHAAVEALTWHTESSAQALRALAIAQASAERPQAMKTFEAALGREAGVAGTRAAYAHHLAARGDARADAMLEAVASDATIQVRMRSAATRARVRIAIDAGRGEDADALLERLESLAPEDDGARLLRAERRLASGDPAGATKLAEASSAEGAEVLVATAALSLNDPSAARAALERAIDASPRDPRLRVLLGAAHVMRGDEDSAKAVIDVLAELDPAAAREDARFVRIPDASWAEAEKQLVLAKNDDGASAAALLAVLRYFRGDDGADKALRAVKPEPLATLMYQADLALTRGATNTANARVAAMRKAAKKAIATNLYAARVALARRRYAEAIGIYDRILAVAQSPLIEIERAEALLATDRDRAKTALAGLAAQAPHFVRLRRALYAAEL